jgi:hypothetical protein
MPMPMPREVAEPEAFTGLRFRFWKHPQEVQLRILTVQRRIWRLAEFEEIVFEHSSEGVGGDLRLFGTHTFNSLAVHVCSEARISTPAAEPCRTSGYAGVNLNSR